MIDLSLEGIFLGLLASDDHKSALPGAPDKLLQSIALVLTNVLIGEKDDYNVNVWARIDALHIEV